MFGSIEIVKSVVLLVLFGYAAPMLGILINRHKQWQRVLFALMCIMTTSGIFAHAEWGLTLHPIDDYRGDARGFHFFFNEVLALALIFSLIFERDGKFRWLPPGLALYFLYCALSLISIVNAPVALYVWMAALKAVKITLFFIATYNFLREEKDVRFFLRVMSATMLWQFLVVLTQRYAFHVYQVRGTFEHQNSLSMYGTMIGMVFLAVGLGMKGWEGNLYLFSYVTCAVAVEFTVSRGGLMAFALGTAAVCLGSLGERITVRRVSVISGLLLLGLLGGAFAFGTIKTRFQSDGAEISSRGRQLLVESALRISRDYPLGIGWNNFALVINQPYPYGDNLDEYEIERGHTVRPDVKKQNVESLYCLLLAETGYQSLICYVAVAAVFLWQNARAMASFRDRFLGCVSLGIAAGCGANYFQSFFERVLIFQKNMALWMLLLGVTARIEMWRRAQLRPSGRARAVDMLTEVAR